MADHTTPADQPSLRADIDSPEFQAVLDEFAYRASERRAMGGEMLLNRRAHRRSPKGSAY